MAEETHDRLLVLLTEMQAVRTELQGITARLDKQNGSIASAIDRINEGEKSLLAHTFSCPLRADVVDIRAQLAEAKGARQNTITWSGWVKPLVMMFVSAMGAVILMHGIEVLKAARP